MTKTVFLLLMVVTTVSSHSQIHYPARTRVRLSSLGNELYQDHHSNLALAKAVALATDQPFVKFLKDGRIAVLDGISRTGDLLYMAPHNQDASTTTQTNSLNSFGILGLDLNGENFDMGVWEVGVPNEDHIEFAGRVEQLDRLSGTVNNENTNHATHVVGTLIAKGVNPDAKGMAPLASVLSSTTQNDNSEMASIAADGLLVSNHSYGFLRGWDDDEWHGNEDISNREDYLFGFYDSKARAWDAISSNAPYYLIVKSAGNDRGDSGTGKPPDCNEGDGYDCLSDGSVAKNVLSVGAVEPITGPVTSGSDIIMSSFSSWGPTDDGRIKPDLVGVGVNVLSSAGSGNSSYATLSGTSMAAPNVAGSLILLQEYYGKLHSKYLLSSSLKGLAIHTAMDAGTSAGPDYSFGWGLLNTTKALLMLKNANTDGAFLFREDTLINNQILSYNIESVGGGITATICWTDPAGISPSPALDPENRMLVNDLDIRLVAPGGEVFLPWRLSPQNPSAQAVKGDNNIDNVEKIEIETSVPGTYTLQITHKGSLSGSDQVFSVFANAQELTDPGAALYWIGGSGNWEDASNWSLTDGGSAASMVPDQQTRVIFTPNSFPADGIMDLTGDAQCLSLSVLADNPFDFRFNGHEITVSENVIISNSKVRFADRGTLRLRNTSAATNLIEMIPEAASATLVLDGGKYRVLSDLRFQSVRLEGGELILPAQNGLFVDSLMSEQNAIAKSISGDTLRVRDAAFIDLSDTALGLDIDGMDVVYPANANAGAVFFTGPAIDNLDITNHSDSLRINTPKINFLNNVSGAFLASSTEVDSLALRAGSKLFLNDGITVTIDEFFSVDSDPSQRTSLISSQPSTISVGVEGVRRYCFDNLNIENVSSTGPTTLVAGENSDIQGTAEGWLEGSCDDLLFADFGAEFPCAGGLTQFNDLSTGNPVSWQWSFGDPASGGLNASPDQHPVHNFMTEGDYLITLTVSDGVASDTYAKTISIIGNDLRQPEIMLSSDFTLFSSVFAQFYQWYINREPVEGADTRFLKMQGQGAYTVEIRNETCSQTSEPFLVTSTEEAAPARFEIFPNPVTTAFLVSAPAESDPFDVEIFDLNGRLMMWSRRARADDRIDVTKLHPGAFIVVITAKTGVLRKILIKN